MGLSWLNGLFQTQQPSTVLAGTVSFQEEKESITGPSDFIYPKLGPTPVLDLAPTDIGIEREYRLRDGKRMSVYE